jgi:hypothetical protein
MCKIPASSFLPTSGAETVMNYLEFEPCFKPSNNYFFRYIVLYIRIVEPVQWRLHLNATLLALFTCTPTLRIGSNVAARCCLFDTFLSSNLSSSLVTLSTRFSSACFCNHKTKLVQVLLQILYQMKKSRHHVNICKWSLLLKLLMYALLPPCVHTHAHIKPIKINMN